MLEKEVVKILKQAGIEATEEQLEEPPQEEFGDIAFPCFNLSKIQKINPNEIANEIVKKIKLPEKSVVEKVETKAGYVNFFLNYSILSEFLLKEIVNKKENFGKSEKIKKKKIMVEHTSVNPNKAIHIGHARNACLGDCLVRILKFLGHDVITTNYIDDTGNQVADNIVAFKFLNFPLEKSGIKFDHYCGDEVYVKINKMYEQQPELLEKRNFVIKKIEEGNNEITKFAKEFSEKILKAQLQTLWRIGIFYDLLNLETDILHLRFWEKAFKTLKKKKYVYFAESGNNKGCWLLKLAHLPEFKDLENPDKILVRSDGTVVYAGKDIAYAMWKHGLLGKDFGYKKFLIQPNKQILWSTTIDGEKKHPQFANVDTSINVIDVRQTHEQQVVANALKMIGDRKKEYIHYAYEVVSLSQKTATKLGIEMDKTKQFVHMSGRKGWFVNADVLLDALFEKAYNETKKRNPNANEDFLRNNAEKIATGAFRYELTKITPEKIIVFDMDEALKLEGDTALYLQYAHTRCSGILNKAKKWKPNFRIKELTREEKNLIKCLMKFSKIVLQAAKDLRPNYICNYAYDLATALDKFYEFCPVLKAENEKQKNFRLTLVKTTKIVLKNCLNLLGIEALEKM